MSLWTYRLKSSISVKHRNPAWLAMDKVSADSLSINDSGQALRRPISPSPLAGEGRERGRTGQLDLSDKAIGRAQPPSPQPWADENSRFLECFWVDIGTCICCACLR
jgi:hypothetical protein